MRGSDKNRIAQILGINRRNLEFVFPCNPRGRLNLVDDKLKAKAILASSGLPTLKTLVSVDARTEIASALAVLAEWDRFAVKPARGSGGSGIAIIKDRRGSSWETADSELWDEKDLRFHFAAILSGMFSLDYALDRAFAEELAVEAPDLHLIHGGPGCCDVRVIVHDSRPVMAMLRIPCSGSRGRANLHAGGLGVGIDMDRGITTGSVRMGRTIREHPDTKTCLRGLTVPRWGVVLECCRPVNDIFGLGYLGVDLIIDRERGPVILELNARPGLDIQLANQAGLLGALRAKRQGPSWR